MVEVSVELSPLLDSARFDKLTSREFQRKKNRQPIPYRTKEKQKVPRASVYTKILEKIEQNGVCPRLFLLFVRILLVRLELYRYTVLSTLNCLEFGPASVQVCGAMSDGQHKASDVLLPLAGASALPHHGKRARELSPSSFCGLLSQVDTVPAAIRSPYKNCPHRSHKVLHDDVTVPEVPKDIISHAVLRNPMILWDWKVFHMISQSSPHDSLPCHQMKGKQEDIEYKINSHASWTTIPDLNCGSGSTHMRNSGKSA
eukprot:6462186-Amphidinium_carterae.1